AYISDTAEFAVSDRLTATPVVGVAIQGVDESAVKATMQLAQQAGAVAPAVLWLQPKWSLTDATDRAKLADVLSISQKKAAAMQVDGLNALAARLAATNASSATNAGVLQELVDAGFVRIETIGDQGTKLDLGTYPGAEARVLLVSGAGAQITG